MKLVRGLLPAPSEATAAVTLTVLTNLSGLGDLPPLPGPTVVAELLSP